MSYLRNYLNRTKLPVSSKLKEKEKEKEKEEEWEDFTSKMVQEMERLRKDRLLLNKLLDFNQSLQQ